MAPILSQFPCAFYDYCHLVNKFELTHKHSHEHTTHTHIHTHTQTHIHTHLLTHIHTHLLTHTYTHIHTHTHTPTYTYTHTHTNTRRPRFQLSTYSCYPGCRHCSSCMSSVMTSLQPRTWGNPPLLPWPRDQTGCVTGTRPPAALPLAQILSRDLCNKIMDWIFNENICAGNTFE
jgi:hypothetical protein